jgi:hypothetical protein
MELKEFIKTTLVDIIEGIEMAQNELKGKNCVINPAHNPDPKQKRVEGDSAKRIGDNRDVEFEVVLSLSDSTSDKASLGVWFANMGIGAQRKTDETASSVTSVKFSVPIVYTSGVKNQPLHTQ